ncbi:hypothetical protein ACOMHN_012607 [Nucella lapillus]
MSTHLRMSKEAPSAPAPAAEGVTMAESAGASKGGHSEAVDVETHSFKKPVKEISCPEHIAKWEMSEAYHDLVGFILTLNEAVKDKKISDSYHVSPRSEELLKNALPEKYLRAIPELGGYLTEGFGNSTRIDYGSVPSC